MWKPSGAAISPASSKHDAWHTFMSEKHMGKGYIVPETSQKHMPNLAMIRTLKALAVTRVWV